MIPPARELLDVLFASIWQGACIAAAVAGVLGIAGTRLNAATRYLVLEAALVAIAVVPLLTTVPNIERSVMLVSGRGAVASSAPGNVGPADGLLELPHRIDVALDDRVVVVLVTAWLVGLAFFTLRICAGSLQLTRLLRRSRRLPDRAGVRFLASPDIGVPLAAGFAAPTVIVPASLAAGASDDFECVVLHELAHLRRGDSYINAAERALHCFLFFNPFVFLVLRAIALEREVACDDWAVAQSRALDTYTRSLASFALWGSGTGAATAWSAPGFGRATLTRIKRLQDSRRNGSLVLSHYALGGFTMMLAIIALTLQSFAPAVAFAPHSPASHVIIATAACHDSLARYVNGPAPDMSNMSGPQKKLSTDVLVQLSPSGKVLNAKVSKSSGNADFDRDVVTAAKKGAYAPAMQNCHAVAGTYTFSAHTG